MNIEFNEQIPLHFHPVPFRTKIQFCIPFSEHFKIINICRNIPTLKCKFSLETL